MSKSPIVPKRKGLALQAKTFFGKSGQTYLVFKALRGNYHVFVETEAKKAAVDCGAPSKGHTRQQWKSVWQKSI